MLAPEDASLRFPYARPEINKTQIHLIRAKV